MVELDLRAKVKILFMLSTPLLSCSSSNNGLVRSLLRWHNRGQVLLLEMETEQKERKTLRVILRKETPYTTKTTTMGERLKLEQDLDRIRTTGEVLPSMHRERGLIRIRMELILG